LRTKRFLLAVGNHSPASLKTRNFWSGTVYADKDVISVLLAFRISGSLSRSSSTPNLPPAPNKPHSRLYPACIDFASRSLPVPSPRQHTPQTLSPPEFTANFETLCCIIARTAQSVQRLATGWTVWDSNPGGGEIFFTRSDRPWEPLTLLYNGYRAIPGGGTADAQR